MTNDQASSKSSLVIRASPFSIMRILVHDYAGHPFQVQLSRELARRGHDVLHLYCSSTHTPRGDLARASGRPARASMSAAIASRKRFQSAASCAATEWNRNTRVPSLLSVSGFDRMPFCRPTRPRSRIPACPMVRPAIGSPRFLGAGYLRPGRLSALASQVARHWPACWPVLPCA